ncbi:hypothetical protein Ssi02_00250 [Sinosporangium siamense]|uniref:DUF3037 domain-containing protein n=1 Tax=Sinosporangium siamense TaxID=1367973 RepID=A0A919V953_9ACTN|nr:hypothetical protein Ssi02_00250 [Sinosporangium siamense]
MERGELINAGVIVYCQPRDFLCAKVTLDAPRVHALDPHADLTGLSEALSAYELACAGTTGPVAGQSPGSRFRWLTAPRSTIVQTGPVHPGLTTDPAGELNRLFTLLVAPL